MSISKFYNERFTVEGMIWYEETAELGEKVAFYGQRQMLQAELAQGYGLSLTGSYQIWCAIDTDVEVQDKITGADEMEYIIKAIRIRNNGINKHKELFVERIESFN